MADDGGRRVTIHQNKEGAEGYVIVVPKSMRAFKKAAGKKLGIKVKKIFLDGGGEVDDVSAIHHDDHIYCSSGKPFYKSAAAARLHEKMTLSMLGGGAVGKSAITLRFVRDCFVRVWDPTIEDAYRKSIDVDDKMVSLEVLDTAGQEDFEALRPGWMLERSAYVFVFSLNNAESLKELAAFYDLHLQVNDSDPAAVPIVLVGNKKDLVDEDPSCREVTEEEARAKAEEYGAIYMETSALTGENITAVFETIVRAVRERTSPVEASSSSWCPLL